MRSKILLLLFALAIYLVDGAISSSSVTHASLVAGAGTTVTVAFTTGTDVPVGGTIEIVFPTGNDVAATTVSSTSGIDSGSTVSSSSGTATVTVANTIMSAGAISFVLNGITNRASGSGGTYSITTKDLTPATIESDASVSGNTFTAGTLGAGTVVPSSTDAGVQGTAVITFTTAVDVVSGGKVKVTFPSEFTVATDTPSSFTGIDASSTTGLSGQVVTLTLAAAMAAGAGRSFTVNLITNPAAKTTGTYTITTTDGSDNVYETKTNVAATTITKTTLTAATITPTSTSAGVQTDYTLTVQTAVDLPIGSKFEIVFPDLASSDFALASDMVSSHSNINVATTSIEFSGSFTVRVVVAGAPATAGSSRTLNVNKITNPAAQATGNFIVRTLDSANAIYEEKTDVTGFTIVKTTLSSASTVTATNCTAGVVTTYTLSLTTAVDYPVASKIKITFPSEFGVASTTVADHSNIDTGTTGIAVASQVVTITVAGAAVTAGTGRVLSVDAITNPGTSCDKYYVEGCSTAWGTYTLQVTDSGDQIYEDNSAITGTPIIKSNVTFARVRTASTAPSTVTTATVTFDSLVTVPVGGKIAVGFPTGFSLGSVAISGHVGLHSSSTSVAVAGQVATVTVATSALSVANGNQFVLSAITTPVAGTTGEYTIKTTDTNDNTIQDKLNIQGEGCVMLNRCNGHGICTILSQRCVCSEGWGAPTDVSLYRSPDCTTRVCPSGPGWNSIPTASTVAHANKECSGMGVCDRDTGECGCFEGYTGKACERRKFSSAKCKVINPV